MVKVSVVIPVYNVEKYLRRCLDSVVIQTLSDIEIICIDDASTDNSYEIVKEYANRDNRIIVAHSSDGTDSPLNCGLSKTRNRGLEIARGEYVLFLDSDDWLEKDAAERLYELAKREILDVLCYDFIVEYETEDIRKKYPINWRRTFCTETALSGQEVFWRQELCDGYYPMAPLMFCRRDYVTASQCELHFYEGILHEDLLFGLKTLMSATRAASVDWQLYHYWRRGGSITIQNHTLDRARSIFIVLYEQLKFLHGQKLSSEAVIAAGKHFSWIFQWFMADIYYPYHDDILSSVCLEKTEHKRAFVFFNQVIKPYYLKHLHPLYRLEEQEIIALKETGKVIIYGAGEVGRRVAETLSKMGIDEFTFAVTKKGENSYFMGSRIYEIAELKSFNADSVVLLSVMVDKQQEMLKVLENFGFRHVIRMIR